MKYTYIPSGVCSRQMLIDIDDKSHIINEIKIIGGCAGNTLGVCKLVKGRKAEEVIGVLQGIKCGYKKTSCPDQLSIAIKEALEQIK